MRTRRLGQTLFSQPFLGEISMNLTIQEIAQAVGSESSATQSDHQMSNLIAGK